MELEARTKLSNESKLILYSLKHMAGQGVIDAAFQEDNRNDTNSDFRKLIASVLDENRERIYSIVEIAYPKEYNNLKLYEVLLNKLLEQNSIVAGMLNHQKESLLQKFSDQFPNLENIKVTTFINQFCFFAILNAFDEYEKSLDEIEEIK